MIEAKEACILKAFRKKEQELLERVPNYTSNRPEIVFLIMTDIGIVYVVYSKEDKRFTHIEYIHEYRERILEL